MVQKPRARNWLRRCLRGGNGYAAIAFLASSAASLLYWHSVTGKAHETASDLASGDLDVELREVKESAEATFDRVYTALRLIASLEHGSSAEPHAVHLESAASTIGMRAAWRNLALDVPTSALHITSLSSAPTSDCIVSVTADSSTLSSSERDTILRQAADFPRRRIGSAALPREARARFTPAMTEPASGEPSMQSIVCSVPCYAADGTLSGVISILIEPKAIAGPLNDPYYVIRHVGTGSHLGTPDAAARIGEGWQSLLRTGNATGYPFSESVKIEAAGDRAWEASGAVPPAEFLANPDFDSVATLSRTLRWGGTSLTLLLTAVTWLMMSSRDRALRLAQSMTASLEEAKDAAESANAAKSEFLARMSHEIRTPLNGVVGMIDLLVHTGMTGVQTRYATLAKEAAGALLLVINDILDFSKIEAGKVEVERAAFDLPALVEDLAQFFSPVAAKQGLALAAAVRPDVPQTVTGDAMRLRQVITNFINNAIKFTPRGAVTVEVSMDEGGTAAAPLVRIEVRDTGIGIPPDRLGRLFKSFSQVDTSTTRRFGGTGLGLAISKRLVELMGGTVGVRSAEGSGTTFWLTLPLDAAHALAGPNDRLEKLRGVRLLAVEPDAEIRRILASQIDGWLSPESRIVSEADEALALLEAGIASGAPFETVLVAYGSDASTELGAAVRLDPHLETTRLLALVDPQAGVTEQATRAVGFRGRVHRPLCQSDLWTALLAANDPAAEPLAEVSPVTLPLQGLYVLVAEDNDLNQFVTRETLRRVGCDCDIVANGADAVRASAGRRYDAILMDCQMPVMDGHEAAAKIRQAEAADPSRRRMPIIALTAEAVSGDRERCIASGMDGYVTKPLDADLLVKVILQWADRSTAARGDADASRDRPTAAPPIDVAGLLERSMNDPAFASTTLEKFAVRATDDIALLRQVAATGAANELKRLSHNLKSVAAHVGATGLRQAAWEIEQASAAGDLSGIEQSLTRLRQEAQRCVAFVPTAIRELKATSELNATPTARRAA